MNRTSRFIPRWRNARWQIITGVLLLIPLLTLGAFFTQGRPAQARGQEHVSVFASGLNNPRGLAFGPDGGLYVAEGGLIVPNGSSTVGHCKQVPMVGPYTGSFTSRISRISRDGTRRTVVDGLPSSQTIPATGSFVSGVAAVAFIGDMLYGLEAGAGCSHGLAGTANTLFRVNHNGTLTTIANLSAFQMSHPVANPEPDDFEPDGTWFSMAAVGGLLYALEPNHGELDRINPHTGAISRVVDISASQGHIVPTALAFHETFVMGNLGLFPVVPGSSALYRITPGGQIRVAVPGLTTVLGLAFDRDGRLYALESDTVAGLPVPAAAGSGMVVRVNADGSLTPIATGLVFPTAMTFGPDGALYVSNFGFGVPTPGAGQILRISFSE
jgi:hypothetical protein